MDYIVLKINPRAKPRVRVNSKRAYYSSKWVKYEQDLYYLLKEQKAKIYGVDFKKPLGLELLLDNDKIVFRLYNVKVRKRSKIRGDIDNIAKGIIDVLQKTFGFDDKMFYSLYVRILD